MHEFLQKVWEIAQPTLLAAIAAILAAGLAWLKKHLDAATQTRVVAETVAAVDQGMRAASGEDKLAVVKEALKADRRVGDVTDAEIEAAVRMLPAKGEPACKPE